METNTITSDNLHKQYEKICGLQNQQKPKKGEVAAADQRHIVKELNEPKGGVFGNEYSLNNFQIGKMLGGGTFGYVQLVESVRTGIAQHLGGFGRPTCRREREREILIQAEMQHTNYYFICDYSSDSHNHGIDVPQPETKNDIWRSSVALTACGTEQYKAPEMWAHEKQTPGVDMWSLGCIFEALTNRLPFPQAKTSDMIAAIDSAKSVLSTSFEQHFKRFDTETIVRKAGSRLTASLTASNAFCERNKHL
ncbi:hypothetical protein GCK72_022343 [Caenorhabditis remanei]|uniref:Protein kinase domain-containing protein n=1 Tax=Caenorhabditis remanei TaxID=31234 RepID=A0A6A5FTT2_CAERE|nr:hypothetical protein GCK72_022343 [Caenorhabditis remanei]KAF1745896.1 hypothetical protein GCK72_022343 [Caenorhabditis remanei]